MKPYEFDLGLLILGLIVGYIVGSSLTKTSKSYAAPAAGGGGAVAVGKSCGVTDGGELEDHDGPRREWQVECADFLNTEATGFFLVPDGSDTISIKLRGPRHSSPTTDKDMCNNIHYFGFGDKISTAPFGKQAGHTAEYCTFGSWTTPMPDIIGKWVGVRAVEYNSGNGVVFKSYIDMTGTGSAFKLYAQATDTGGLGTCKGPASPANTKATCSISPVVIGFRIDGSPNVKSRGILVKEIAPPTV